MGVVEQIFSPPTIETPQLDVERTQSPLNIADRANDARRRAAARRGLESLTINPDRAGQQRSLGTGLSTPQTGS